MQQKSEFEMSNFIEAFAKSNTSKEFFNTHKQLKNQGIELTYEMYEILFDLVSTYSDAKKVIRFMKKSNFDIDELIYLRMFWKVFKDEDERDKAIDHYERFFKRPATFDGFEAPYARQLEFEIWFETKEKLEYNYDLIFKNHKISEEDFQNQIQDKNILIDKIVDKPKIVERNIKILSRNPLTSSNAINRANFQCEIDIEHETFINNNSKKQYIEAHHLIPLKYQSQFDSSLDVEANIVALCPNCHRKLHHGVKKDVYDDIETLFNTRNERLSKCRLDIKLDQLQKMY